MAVVGHGPESAAGLPELLTYRVDQPSDHLFGTLDGFLTATRFIGDMALHVT